MSRVIDMPRLIPRPDQEEKIQRVLEEPTHAALIADDMGAGKTVMAVEIALRSGQKRILVVGIRDTSKQWAATFAGQSDGRVKLRVINSTKKGKANFDALMDGEPGIYFAGVQWLTRQDWEVIRKVDRHGNYVQKIDKKTLKPLFKERRKGEIGPALIPDYETISMHKDIYGRRLKGKRAVDMLIIDEIHLAQNRHSQRGRTLSHIKAEWRLGLSGTFTGNSFEGAWKVTRILWPDLIDTSFVRWRARWCTTKTPLRRGGEPLKDARGNLVEQVTGEKNEGEFVASLPCYIRDEPEPVPPARIVKVKLTPRQSRQYESLRRDSMAWLEAHTPLGKKPLLADLPITQRQRLRTATLGEMSFNEDDELGFADDCASAKLNALKYIIDNVWNDGRSVLIGAYSARFIVVAAERFKRAGYGAVAWHGGVSSREREQIKTRFIARDPSARLLFATIPSIGTGVDGLQKSCSTVAWLERSESRLDNSQFVKRVCRPGMCMDFGPFEHVELIAEGTLDEGILFRQTIAAESMSRTLRSVA